MHLAAAAGFVWLEGEKPTQVNYEPKPEGVGHPEFLSEKAWLKVAIDGGQVEREAPAEGVLLDYAFDAKTAGEYEVWARIGYEFVRSPFDWRLDGGEWKSVSPDDLTTDLMELSFWTEVAWLKLGKQSLAAGRHTLSFRLPKTKDAQGKPQRILFALDCVCLAAGEFHPYQFYKPGEEHQTDRDREAAQAGVPACPPPQRRRPRVSLPLNGLWEICRHDEQLPGEVAAPIRDFPAAPRWTAIEVPGDKNQRDDLVFAHRLWYRTRVHVPDSLAGRSMILVFPANNLNTTIYVNGQYCGFDKNPFARLQFDITKAVRPGVNELRVGIKDGWYGYRADPADPHEAAQALEPAAQLLQQRLPGTGLSDLEPDADGHRRHAAVDRRRPGLRGGRLLQTVRGEQEAGRGDHGPEQPPGREAGRRSCSRP